MRNFFSSSRNPKVVKRIKSSLFLLMLLFSITIFTNGCRTTRVKTPVPAKKINTEERIKNAEAVKASLLKQLEYPKSVDQSVRIKDELDKLQSEIETLKSGKDIKSDENEGFENVKGKTVIYGPLGIVLQLTEWILKKLYIIYET